MVCTLIHHRNVQNVQNSSGTTSQRAAEEWFHFKVTWKLAVDLSLTISLASDNFDIHQRLDNACEKEKNKLRRHHIIFIVCSAGSRP